MKTSNRINYSDTLHLTVMNGRKMVASICMSGVTDLSEIYKSVSESVKEERGVITLFLRNRTQGWIQRHTMVLNRAKPSGTSVPAKGGEYPSLFGNDSFES